MHLRTPGENTWRRDRSAARVGRRLRAHVDLFHLGSGASGTRRRPPPPVPGRFHILMEEAGNGRPGVGSPSGGGIRVIDNVSCWRDGESPRDPPRGTDWLQRERERGGGDIFEGCTLIEDANTNTCVYAATRVSLHVSHDVPKTPGREEKRGLLDVPVSSNWDERKIAGTPPGQPLL